MSRAFPEGNLQLRSFVFPSFFYMIWTWLVTEQFLDRRSSGGQCERMEDSVVQLGATKFFSK